MKSRYHVVGEMELELSDFIGLFTLQLKWACILP